MKLRVQIDDHTFEVDIADLAARPILATVDGETFAVMPDEGQANVLPNGLAVSNGERAAVRAALPTTTSTPSTAPRSAITAPIPGLIISVEVKAGDQVKAGQPLCVLEAMKMKNTIRAPREGTIGTVHISAGQHVSQRQLMVEYVP
jgi:biotin carboxyl carrier protein